MAKRIPVWIDTDCGVDDSLAILNALKLEQLEVVGLSAVAGNAELKYTFKNTRNVLSLAGREDVPVYKGADRPMMIPLVTAAHVHGEDGLGGAIIPESQAKREEKPAWDALYEAACKYEGELAVCAVGPLTNIAITIVMYPDFIEKIGSLNIMGGSIAAGGNVSMTAEFNIAVDPQAAEVVFKSGVHVNMFPLDVTMKCFLNKADYDEVVAYGSAVSKLVNDEMTFYLRKYDPVTDELIRLHDSCPVLWLAYPEYFRGVDCGVYTETKGSITAGKTVSDMYSYTKFKHQNVTVFMECDKAPLVEIVKATLKSYC